MTFISIKKKKIHLLSLVQLIIIYHHFIFYNRFAYTLFSKCSHTNSARCEALTDVTFHNAYSVRFQIIDTFKGLFNNQLLLMRMPLLRFCFYPYYIYPFRSNDNIIRLFRNLVPMNQWMVLFREFSYQESISRFPRKYFSSPISVHSSCVKVFVNTSTA